MDQGLEQRDSNERTDDVQKKNKENSHKCNQCEYASSYASSLRTHLKMHSGEKSNKCNQCDYVSFEASNLRRHLEMHCGEKFNKCKQ